MNKFSIGDSVKLKTGGITMVVDKLGQREGGRYTVTCVWCNNAGTPEPYFATYTFDAEALKKVD